jgi:hypothetical protein
MLDRSPALLMLDPHFTSTTGLLTGLRIKLEFEKTRRAHMQKFGLISPTLPSRPRPGEMERQSLVDGSSNSLADFDGKYTDGMISGGAR